MVREIKELDEIEVRELINRISNTMMEFDISKDSINSFWKVFKRGSTVQVSVKQESDPGVAYI